MMIKALAILEDIRETKWCGVKPTCQNFTIADFDKAIIEIKAFEKECENLVIESNKLVNETLNLSDIIIKQNKRIVELEETLKKRECCLLCKDRNGCKFADNVIEQFGIKSHEMWFSCFKSKE